MKDEDYSSSSQMGLRLLPYIAVPFADVVLSTERGDSVTISVDTRNTISRAGVVYCFFIVVCCLH